MSTALALCPEEQPRARFLGLSERQLERCRFGTGYLRTPLFVLMPSRVPAVLWLSSPLVSRMATVLKTMVYEGPLRLMPGEEPPAGHSAALTVLAAAGVVSRRLSRYYLTTRGWKLAQTRERAELFSLTYRALAANLRDPFGPSNIPVLLHMLRVFGPRGTRGLEFAEAAFTTFPELRTSDYPDLAAQAFISQFMDRFLLPLGLVDREHGGPSDPSTFYRTTGLFDVVIRWRD